MTADILSRHEAELAAKQERNRPLLEARLAALNARPGPRVGDYLRLPRLHPRLGEWTRITHDHGDLLQTGGNAGSSYYLGAGGGVSYSGGLDRGVIPGHLVPTADTRPGNCWFFDEGRSGAGRGVTFTVEWRVFDLRPGADLSGIAELECPFMLTVADAAMQERTGYRYLITERAYSHSACRTAEELPALLARDGLKLTEPLPADHASTVMRLAYA